jgi:hypothetical protein
VKRYIILMTVLIAAVLLGTSALAYAKQSDNKADQTSLETTSSETTSPETTSAETTGPITSQDHAWGKYHWARTSNPFTLNLGDNLSSDWKDYLKTASSDWSASAVLDTSIVAGKSNKKCAATSGQDEVCNRKYGKNGWLGMATIWADRNSHITQGTVKFNDTYFSTAKYNTPAWRQMVTCQEVAHTFGMDHQDENFSNTNLNTCMDYTNDPSTNQHPNQGDMDELLCIYDPGTEKKTLTTETHSCTGTGHLDSYTTLKASLVGSTSPGKKPSDTGDEPGDTPAQWGKEVKRSVDGRVSVYELDPPKGPAKKGGKKITIVRWTEEQAAKNKKT